MTNQRGQAVFESLLILPLILVLTLIVLSSSQKLNAMLKYNTPEETSKAQRVDVEISKFQNMKLVSGGLDKQNIQRLKEEGWKVLYTGSDQKSEFVVLERFGHRKMITNKMELDL